MKRKRRASYSQIVKKTLQKRTGALMASVTHNNALLSRLEKEWASRPKPKPLTKAQIAKRNRDEALGRKYLAKAHALGVYEEDRDD